MIVPMREEHLESVARLHKESVGGLLSDLGTRAVRAFYDGALLAGQADSFVFTRNGEVCGFVAGAVDPDALRREAFRARPLRTLLGALVGVVSKPGNLVHLWRHFQGESGGRSRVEAAELIYIAVDRRSRGQGVGRQLVEAYLEALSARGIPACELSVDADNRGAAAAYEKLGFRRLEEYFEFGRRRRRYRLEIGGIASTRGNATRGA